MRGNKRRRTVLLTAAFFAAMVVLSLFMGNRPGYADDNRLTPDPLPRELTTTQAYVNATTGVDGSGGTLSAPWKTITYALQKATPATNIVINVAPGTYPENLAGGVSLLIHQDGTTITRLGTGDVVLDSGGVMTSTSTLDIGGFSNITISGLKFINRPGGYGIAGWGASTGQHDINVTGCYFDKLNGGVSMLNATGLPTSPITKVTVGTCTFTNVATPLLICGCDQVTADGLSITQTDTTLSGRGIWFGTFPGFSATPTNHVSIVNSTIWGTAKGITFNDVQVGLVEHNQVSNCHIHHIGIYNSAPDILRNTIIGNPASDTNNGLLLSLASSADVSPDQAKDLPLQASVRKVRRATLKPNGSKRQAGAYPSLVQNNFIDSTSLGIETHGGSKIYNNTIVNSQPSLALPGKGIYVGDGTPDIKYNIIYNYTDYGIFSNSTISANYNDIISSTGVDYGGGVTPGPNSFGVDPKFASPQSVPSTSDNYRLTDLSPCIDATDRTDVGIDLGGSLRPFGPFWDMGCYEYGSPVSFKLAVAGGTTAASYVMITIPLTVSPNDIISVLTPTFGPYVPTSWRVFRYDPGTLNYLEAPSVPAVVSGASYFLISANSATITLTGNPGPPVRIMTIPPGWNMIGNPYRFSLSVNNIMVSADGVGYVSMTVPTQTLTNKTLWQWTGGPDYVAGSVIAPGSGGFLKNITGSNVFVKFSPIPATPFDLKKRTLAGDHYLSVGEDRPPAPPGAK
ncbi:MAG: right-handed parallel beta-helix repeat-containing protein [Deltaproteobacteria bacterium]|nr:right-handed parallel beta-helix repeat-containing protein [Deltaproteobacteria bacterium]